jgi:hypothetical protein
VVALRGVIFAEGGSIVRSTTAVKSIHDLAVGERTVQLSAVISGTFIISKNLLNR